MLVGQRSVGTERQLWREAAEAAELKAEQLEALAVAGEREEGLEDQLTVMLATLSANLAGPFLRSFVERLDARDRRGSKGSVVPALREAIRGTPMPKGGSGDAGG